MVLESCLWSIYGHIYMNLKRKVFSSVWTGRDCMLWILPLRLEISIQITHCCKRVHGVSTLFKIIRQAMNHLFGNVFTIFKYCHVPKKKSSQSSSPPSSFVQSMLPNLTAALQVVVTCWDPGLYRKKRNQAKWHFEHEKKKQVRSECFNMTLYSSILKWPECF